MFEAADGGYFLGVLISLVVGAISGMVVRDYIWWKGE